MWCSRTNRIIREIIHFIMQQDKDLKHSSALGLHQRGRNGTFWTSNVNHQRLTQLSKKTERKKPRKTTIKKRLTTEKHNQ